jgi:hypothetical protein
MHPRQIVVAVVVVVAVNQIRQDRLHLTFILAETGQLGLLLLSTRQLYLLFLQ